MNLLYLIKSKGHQRYIFKAIFINLAILASRFFFFFCLGDCNVETGACACVPVPVRWRAGVGVHVWISARVWI